jgi:hypothetical protein
MPGKAKQARPYPKHAIRADKTIPRDHAGNEWCVRCQHMGKPGDVRHSGEDDWPPDRYPPVPDGDVSDRILGEAAGG